METALGLKSLQDLLRGSEGKSALLDSEFKAAQGGGGESAVKKTHHREQVLQIALVLVRG